MVGNVFWILLDWCLDFGLVEFGEVDVKVDGEIEGSRRVVCGRELEECGM